MLLLHWARLPGLACQINTESFNGIGNQLAESQLAEPSWDNDARSALAVPGAPTMQHPGPASCLRIRCPDMREGVHSVCIHPTLPLQYMAGGDLGTALSLDANEDRAKRRLGWYARGRIVLLCVARGLAYLHSERVCCWRV